MKLENNLIIELAIDGVTVPLDQFGCPFLQVDSNSDLGLPCAYLMMVDASGIIRRGINLREGISLEVSVGNDAGDETSEGNITTYPFRISDVRTTGHTIEIWAYLDYPRYVASVWKKPVRGTAMEVLRSIAEDVGLAFSGDLTQDRGVWRPSSGERTLNFARRVAEYCWGGDGSLFYGGISLSGELRFRNVLAERKLSAAYGFQGVYLPITGCRPMLDGLANLFGGYSRTVIEQNVLGTVNVHDKIQLDIAAEQVNRNEKVAKHIEQGVIDMGPILHPAAVHSNYSKAYHHNLRGRTMMNMVVQLACPVRAPVEVLDTVLLDLNRDGLDPSKATSENRKYSGRYIVREKGFVVKDNNYTERLVCMREGMNNEQST